MATEKFYIRTSITKEAKFGEYKISRLLDDKPVAIFFNKEDADEYKAFREEKESKRFYSSSINSLQDFEDYLKAKGYAFMETEKGGEMVITQFYQTNQNLSKILPTPLVLPAPATKLDCL